jgi:hypothetical protein
VLPKTKSAMHKASGKSRVRHIRHFQVPQEETAPRPSKFKMNRIKHTRSRSPELLGDIPNPLVTNNFICWLSCHHISLSCHLSYLGVRRGPAQDVVSDSYLDYCPPRVYMLMDFRQAVSGLPRLRHQALLSLYLFRDGLFYLGQVCRVRPL